MANKKVDEMNVAEEAGCAYKEQQSDTNETTRKSSDRRQPI